MSLTAFSQKGTSKKDSCTVTLPCRVANKVAVDLVRCDSIAAELSYTQSVLDLKEQKIAEQNQVIQEYATKDSIYKEQVYYCIDQVDKCESIVKGLEKDKKRLKVQQKVLGFLASVTATAALVEFLIIKSQ